MSHWFLDCFLSWVLMSCSLNHCIITALIHSPAYPLCLLTIKNEWTETQLSKLTTSSLKWHVGLCILDFNKLYFSRHKAAMCKRLTFLVTNSCLAVNLADMFTVYESWNRKKWAHVAAPRGLFYLYNMPYDSLKLDFYCWWCWINTRVFAT